jgi:hypothetical protein
VFSFDTGDGKPPTQKAGGSKAPAAKAAAPAAAAPAGDKAELEAQWKAAWAAAKR